MSKARRQWSHFKLPEKRRQEDNGLVPSSSPEPNKCLHGFRIEIRSKFAPLMDGMRAQEVSIEFQCSVSLQWPQEFLCLIVSLFWFSGEFIVLIGGF